MKILFAVSNENIAEAIKMEYQSNYKAQLLTKNVYYFNAIIKELQNNKTYDVVIASEDLEPFANNNYDTIDKFLAEKLQTIREEALNAQGMPVPIIFITTDRHILGDFLTSKLYEIGIYNALVGADRSIENVCTLMFHPRNKKEARNYYRVNAEIETGPKEDDVKEDEIKNIIAHYKKLGKAEEKYAESFDNIASQYNDAQLKVIIRFLPLNVKAVLEAQSSKYQSLTTFANNYGTGAISSIPQNGKNDNIIKEKSANVDVNNNRVLEQISSIQNNSKVIIPNAMNVNNVKKIETQSNDKPDSNSSIVSSRADENTNGIIMMNRRKADETVITSSTDDVLPGFESFDEDNNQEQPVTTVKRGRGRPKKVLETSEIVQEGPKRGRGRPKKNVEIESEQPNLFEMNNEEVSSEPVLPGFEMNHDEVPSENVLPGFESNDVDVTENVLPGVENETTLPGFETLENKQSINTTADFSNPFQNIQKTNNMSEKQSLRYENIEYLIPADKKVVSFIGSSKSGVSFIVNNLAQMLSSFNINVAILDMTKNKNSFYIYTNNDEALRSRASKSIYNLLDGFADGIKINKNLTLYTSLPTDEEKFYEADKVLKTLIDNHSIILIDSDYDTPIGYFDNSTDMFMVQNMDILTMQPLTTFLKELKSKNVLKDEKLKMIVNMETKVKGINPQVLLNAISVYKDPGMAYTVDLFDKMSTKLFTIPFDIEAYNKYLTTLVDCNLSLTGYPKMILASLKEICGCIYPLIGGKAKTIAQSYTPPSLNNYTSPFNGSVDSTLNQMKNRY